MRKTESPVSVTVAIVGFVLAAVLAATDEISGSLPKTTVDVLLNRYALVANARA